MRNTKFAFSLIEVSVLLVILGVLIAFAMSMYAPLARYNLAERSAEDTALALERIVQRISQDYDMFVLRSDSQGGKCVNGSAAEREKCLAKYKNGSYIVGSSGNRFQIMSGYTETSTCWNKSSDLNVRLCQNRNCDNARSIVTENVALFLASERTAFDVTEENGRRWIKVAAEAASEAAFLTHDQLRDKLECSNATIIPRGMEMVTAANAATSFYSGQGLAGLANWTMATSNGWPLYWCVTLDLPRESPNGQHLYGGNSSKARNPYCYPQGGPTTWRISLPGDPDPTVRPEYLSAAQFNTYCNSRNTGDKAYAASRGDLVYERIVTRDEYPNLSINEYNKFCETLAGDSAEAKNRRARHLFYGDRFDIFVNTVLDSNYPPAQWTLDSHTYQLGTPTLFLGAKPVGSTGVKITESTKMAASRGTYHINAYVSDDPEFKHIIDKTTLILKP